MTAVAYGIAMPAVRAVLGRPTPAPAVLDQVSGVTITGAWSMERALLASFGSGNRFRVRDTTTSGFQDCATPAAASSFLGGDSGAVVSLYDQSGNGRTLTNATASQQPAFATGIGPNGRAGAAFDATNDKLVGPALSNFMTAASGYVVAVLMFNALATTNQQVWADTSGYVALMGQSASTLRVYLYDTGYHTADETIAAGAVVVHEWWHQGGTLYARLNGGTVSSTAAGDVASLASFLGVGRVLNAWNAMNGSILEFATMSGVPAQADSVVDDMKLYYGIA